MDKERSSSGWACSLPAGLVRVRLDWAETRAELVGKDLGCSRLNRQHEASTALPFDAAGKGEGAAAAGGEGVCGEGGGCHALQVRVKM